MDDSAGFTGRPLTEAEITTGLPELPAPDASPPSAAAGPPITPEMLRAMLSCIDPIFAGDQMAWLGIAKAIRHRQLPGIEGMTAEDAEDLLNDWCSGRLLAERLGQPVEIPTYKGREELLARTADKPRQDGPRIGLGTIIKLAQAGGYTGPIEAPRPSAEVFSEALAHLAAAAPAEVKPPPPGPQVKLFSLAEADALPKPVYLVDGILPDRSTVILSAPMNNYKTFGASEIAMAVATGMPAFGTRAVLSPGLVVYLTNEGFGGVVMRMKDWCRRGSAPDWRSAL